MGRYGSGKPSKILIIMIVLIGLTILLSLGTGVLQFENFFNPTGRIITFSEEPYFFLFSMAFLLLLEIFLLLILRTSKKNRGID